MEAAGTVPSDLVERLKGIGVFRMFVPHTAERATRPHQAPKRPGACSLTYRNLRPRSLGNLRANLDVVRGKLAGLIVRVPVEGVVTAKVSYLCSHPRRQRTTLPRQGEPRSPEHEVNCNKTLLLRSRNCSAKPDAIGLLIYINKRSQRLRAKFGPEYIRAVQESGSKYRAESKLEKIEKRVGKFSIQPRNRRRQTVFMNHGAR
jgi:hypothetical protein